MITLTCLSSCLLAACTPASFQLWLSLKSCLCRAAREQYWPGSWQKACCCPLWRWRLVALGKGPSMSAWSMAGCPLRWTFSSQIYRSTGAPYSQVCWPWFYNYFWNGPQVSPLPKCCRCLGWCSSAGQRVGALCPLSWLLLGFWPSEGTQSLEYWVSVSWSRCSAKLSVISGFK